MARAIRETRVGKVWWDLLDLLVSRGTKATRATRVGRVIKDLIRRQV